MLDLLHKGLPGFLVTAGAAAIVIVFVGGLGGAGVGLLPSLLVILAAGLLGGFIQRTLVLASGRAAAAIHAPSGDSTAYVPTFSHIEALEVRGDLDGAAEAWEIACAEHPTNALVRVKAADFHLRLRKDAVVAMRLYKGAREIPGASRELVRYAQSKIVDLHLEEAGGEGRAMVELRRLIEWFPGTVEAESARAALARLKGMRGGERE